MRLLIGNKNYSSWSMRPWLLLKHFAIPFTEEFVGLHQADYRDAIAARSPSGTVPVLFDGDLTLPDSLAIIEYIADAHPNKPIWPADMASRALARSAAAEMHAGFSDLRAFAPMNIKSTLPGRVPYERVKANMRRLEVLWGELLARSSGPYLFGAFSAADAMFAPVAARIVTYDIPVSSLSKSYIGAVYDLPAFKDWQAAAIAEPWRIERAELDVDEGANQA